MDLRRIIGAMLGKSDRSDELERPPACNELERILRRFPHIMGEQFEAMREAYEDPNADGDRYSGPAGDIGE